MYRGFSALYTHAAGVQAVEACWSEGATPLVLDAFQVYVWAAPLTTLILTGVGPGSDMTRAGMVVALLGVTLVVNLVVLACAREIHTRTGVADSTLFRAGWVFVCAHAVSRATAGGGGVATFAVVSLLPLVYVRVSGSLTGCTALYAAAFFALAFVRNVLEPPRSTATEYLFWRDEDAWEPRDREELAVHCLVFAGANAFHALWAASHAHTLNRATLAPVPAYMVALPSVKAALPMAAFRAGVVLLSMLLRESPAGDYRGAHRYLQTLRVAQALALCVTISTLTAWAHCQHRRANSLRSVLAASVTAAACGMLVDSMQEIFVLSLLFPFGVALDTLYFADGTASPVQSAAHRAQKQDKGE